MIIRVLPALAAVVLIAVASARAAESSAPFNPKIDPASDAPERAMRGMKLPEGFQVELFAAEPMLANPVGFGIDEKGRVFVAETFRHGTSVKGHFEWLDEDLSWRTVDERVADTKRLTKDLSLYTRDHERIRLLVDSDGDGKADRSTVFADGFNSIAAGLATDILARRGNVYFACVPDLWLLRDHNQDGHADERTSLHYGYGVHIGYTAHDLHSLELGPDGKLYFTMADRGLHVEQAGRVLDFPDTGTCLRCNLDGSELEVFATGLRNPQDLAFDEFGNLFTGDNNADGGDKARVVHIVEGGDSGWRIGYQFISPQTRAWNTERLWHLAWPGQAAYIVPPIGHLSSGPSGLEYYPGFGWSDDYRGTFFLCDYRYNATASTLFSFKLAPQGASFALTNVAPFLKGSVPTDVEFGYDGALYISEMAGTPPQVNSGRIYKVVDPARRASADVLAMKKLFSEGFAQRNSPELVKLLDHPDMRVRLEAQFALAERGAPATLRFAEVARTNANRLARLHAIWGLGQITTAKRDVNDAQKSNAARALLPLLRDKDSEIRAQAAKVLGDSRHAAAGPALVPLLKDSESRVRFFAAMSLGKLKPTNALPALIEMLRANSNTDPFLRHAGVMGLFYFGQPDALLAFADDKSSAARLGVLLALRRLGDAHISRFLEDADPALVLEAARAINDVPIPAALPALAKTLPRIQASPPASSSVVAARTQSATSQFTAEFWDEFRGSLADVAAGRNLDAPTRVIQTLAFETPPNRADQYAARVRGWIEAPQSGEYIFWVAGDDASELWLSSDETAENKSRIASAPSFAARYDWEKEPSQRSKPVRLEAGKRYFLEAVMIEGSGEDHVAVGWQLPDGKLERPIGSGEARQATPANAFDPAAALALRALNANFRLGGAEHAEAVANFAANPLQPLALRTNALGLLATWAKPSQRDLVVGVYRPLPTRNSDEARPAVERCLPALLRSSEIAAQLAALKLIGQFGLKADSSLLSAWVWDTRRPAAARAEALRLVAAHGTDDLQIADTVRLALRDNEPAVRSEARALLAVRDPELAVIELQQTLARGDAPEKQRAAAALGEMKIASAGNALSDWLDKLRRGEVAPEVQLDLLEAAHRHATAAENSLLLRKLADHQSELPASDPLAIHRVALSGGSAEAGRKLFRDHVGGQCIRCHKIKGMSGGEVGPDLTQIGARLTREQLLESLITPNAQISPGYSPVSLTLKNGESADGVLKLETAEVVELVTVENKTLRVPAVEIASRRTGLSPMYSMAGVLTARELRDLIEFLAALR